MTFRKSPEPLLVALGRTARYDSAFFWAAESGGGDEDT